MDNVTVQLSLEEVNRLYEWYNLVQSENENSIEDDELAEKLSDIIDQF